MTPYKSITVLSLLLLLFSCSKISDTSIEVIFEHGWKFKTGDSICFKEASYDDSKWDTIQTSRSWESQGFSDYNGYAWYRISIVIPSTLKADKVGSLIFALGTIDDNDQVFLNGQLIGINGTSVPDDTLKETDQMDIKGSFYTTNRLYEIQSDSKFIFWDKPNIVAIRVLDKLDDGGMRSGIPFLYASSELPENHRRINLNKGWKFRRGNDKDDLAKVASLKDWVPICPDLEWEQQGQKGYDGFAWYRIKIQLRSNLGGVNVPGNKMRIYLGTIDDYDQVFLNGYLIGQNGNTVAIHTKPDTNFRRGNSCYDKDRKYFLDLKDKRIHWNQDNTLTIKVYDAAGGGGMTHGLPQLTIVPKDRFQIDKSKFYTFSLNSLTDTLIVFRNLNASEQLCGNLHIKVQNAQNKKVLYQKDFSYSAKPNDSARIPIGLPPTMDITNVILSVQNQKGRLLTKETFNLPFVLQR